MEEAKKENKISEDLITKKVAAFELYKETKLRHNCCLIAILGAPFVVILSIPSKLLGYVGAVVVAMGAAYFLSTAKLKMQRLNITYGLNQKAAYQIKDKEPSAV